MTSYLSYFTSHNSSAPSSQASTPGTTSTWSSTFTSRIATLRKALTKDSEEDDPDNEDCSHISNVLRAYYTEKGRPFPEWLPPDPKKPIVVPHQPEAAYGQYAGAYGSQYGIQQTHSRGSSGGRGGGLSDLWDSTPAPAAPPSQSLRAARITPHSLRSHDSTRSQSSGSGQTATYDAHNHGPRPLPSQRAGSYQTNATPAALGSRDRLRARLQGGGSGRSSPSAGSSGGGSGALGSYGAPGGGYGSQNRSGSSQPYMSASEPWSTGAAPNAEAYGYDTHSSGGGLASTPSHQYGGRDYRQRPGGPR
ncbi:hypothetical protein ABEF95_003230 [Exophiala dermatitidis]